MTGVIGLLQFAGICVIGGDSSFSHPKIYVEPRYLVTQLTARETAG
jgi:hypothetical protein